MKRMANCPVCQCEVALPEGLFEAVMHSHKISYHCAYGHSQHLSEDGIRKYWTDKAFKAQPVTEIPDNTNVIQFKRKGHETQQHS